MNIAIQGLDTSFHAAAAKQLYGTDANLICCQTFNEVFVSLNEQKAERAVVAIENSLYGSINEVYDLLIRYDFKIISEVYEQIGLHLMSVSGAAIKDITNIYSQAPALAESEDFLNKALSHADRHEYHDTAMAAKEVKRMNSKSNAAIASIEAAKKYNLDVLAKNIETHPHNYTRFIVLEKTSFHNSSADKSSITFQTKDTPGSLYNVLGVFAKNKINLSKLESRPIAGKAWQYMYYLDFEENISEDLIREVSTHATNVKVLGTYKKGFLEKI
jgi:prephenate dehydratase